MTGHRPPTDTMFRALLESAPDAMVIVDAFGQIILVNAQTERMFGFRREELLGQPVEILVPLRYGADHVAHRTAYVASARARPMGAGLDLFGRRKDGSEFPVEISLSPLDTDQGLLVASAIRDITDRKAAEAERERLVQERAAHAEANRIKDEFLATLSHELRTPLNAILGWVSLIEAGGLSDDQLRRALTTIGRNARTQAQLVEDLLDVSRIISGKLKVRMAALDLSEVAEAAVEVVRPAAQVKRIELHATFEQRPVLTIGDADRLQQVIWNLLSNAIKFTPAHGRVELRLGTRTGCVEIVVRDTGQGIPPAFIPHVFDRFRQADSSTTRPYGGLGLGLAIAKSIVELHGGTIGATSLGIGRGSTFRVELPTGAVADRRGAVRTAAATVALQGTRVLIVDDEEDERILLSTIFEQAGSEVRAVRSVAEALQLVPAWTPDVIVSDLAMPHEDGYALIRRLREMPGFRRLPAIAVTAHARPEDRDATRAAGFDGYIPKPLDRESLLARVSLLVGQARARERPPVNDRE